MFTTLSHSTKRVIGSTVLAVSLLQFLVVHLLVESRWDPPYSWATNNISDLGNVTCGAWGPDDRYVCSPWHDLMNVSFVVFGIGIAVGTIILGRAIGLSRTAAVLVVSSGLGYVLAGIYPADVDENMHVLGALFVFFPGNLGLLVLGLSRGIASGRLRIATAAAGVVGLVSMMLFLARVDVGIGLGGLERVPAYLPTLWLLVVAIAGGSATTMKRGGAAAQSRLL